MYGILTYDFRANVGKLSIDGAYGNGKLTLKPEGFGIKHGPGYVELTARIFLPPTV